MDGFCKFVEDTWKDCPNNDSNAMLNLMGKLKFLKTKIRVWYKSYMVNRKQAKEQFKTDLEAVDAMIDSGNGNEEIVVKRMDLVKNLQQINNLNSMEMAQKANVRWAVEGDENSSFFHGTINRKRSVLAVRGIMVDGLWIDESRLIGSLYKIIAKILANRLVDKLGLLVNEVQYAFIADRQILDGPFILDELIQWCKRKKNQLLVFKVDFEKAFDSVRWDFLDDILKKFGFGEKWFMESLHISFQRVEDAGLFNGIKLDNSVSISHLFYADDAVFVGQWCENNINTLVCVLECFFRASGLRINMSKSKLMGLHVDSDKIKAASSKLGCLTLKTPFTYLGSTVGGSMSCIKTWDDVVDRVSSRLSKWKIKCCRLEASLVNWKNALASKKKGGLGIASLYALNRGLMFKWYWRFQTQGSSLWSRVIKALHGESGKVNASSGLKTSWTNIVKEVNFLGNKDGLTGFLLKLDFRKSKRGGGTTSIRVRLLVGDTHLIPMEDRWTWNLSSSGEFFVSSVRCLIDDKTLPVFDHQTRWVRFVPIKVNVIAWKVKNNSLPTRFNISRRGISINCIKCVICDIGVETVNHLFFSCELVTQLVKMIVRWWSVPYLEIDSYADWVSSH
ncbi:RNA-directed DNA polymerase, eukaryota, reverse transcriptase zinc-binding domain protein [Tanacetum coccineum]